MSTVGGAGVLTGTTRQRLQHVAAGCIGAVAAVCGAAAIRLGSDRGPAVWVVALVGGSLVLIAALAGGSVRARRESSRVLVVCVEIAALSLTAVAGLAVLLLVLGRLPEGDEQLLVLPAITAVVVAPLVHPALRRWLVAATLHSATGRRRSPEEVLQAFGDRAARAVPLEELLLQLGESLRTALGLHNVEVWTGSGSSLQRILSVPHRAAAVTNLGPAELDVLRRAGVAGEGWLALWLPQLLVGRAESQVRIAPAGHSGELLGLLIVERAPDGERFGEADERSLGEAARRLGIVLHNRQLDSALQATLDDLQRTNEELRASRSRLVAASDAERRRIERDIHDGAQQHLVALAVNLGLARDVLRDDPDAANELLTEMATDVRETIQQVRDLAHGIYPPLLRESGLEEALRAAVTRSPVPMTLVADGVARYRPDIETAVYFCCLEALQNTAKHAPDAAVTVTLRQEESTLVFEVVDDGPGFDPATTAAGQGYQNMTDRIGAIGGLLSWASTPGAGTQVRGEVPLAVTAPVPPGGTP